MIPEKPLKSVSNVDEILKRDKSFTKVLQVTSETVGKLNDIVDVIEEINETTEISEESKNKEIINLLKSNEEFLKKI